MTTSPDRPTDPFYHRHVPEAHGTAAGKTPWWGPSTSSVDWCEANYRHNERVAELWNTLSSIPLVLVMIYGLVKCHQHNIEWRFRLCYIALGVVGCGSVAFHATMTHAGQASDELAMIYGGLVFLHASLEVERRERTFSKLLTPLLEAAYSVFFTAAYFAFPQFFAFFVLAYIGLIAVILKQTYRAYTRYLAEDSAAGFYQRLLFRFSFGTYAFGFLALWIPENALCPYFPRTMQWLNLHAWFHLTSTAAPYNLLVFLTFHRLRILKRAAEHRAASPWIPGMLYVHALDSAAAEAGEGVPSATSADATATAAAAAAGPSEDDAAALLKTG